MNKANIIKTLFAFHLTLCFVFTTHAQIHTEEASTFCIGETRILKSVVLNEERAINIYLPYNYNNTKSYPVIYLLDGSIDEDFLHIVGLVQFFHLQYKMPDFIVVGITNVDRKRDFTFQTDLKELQEKYPTTGGSEKFITFLETELQPFIQKNYQTDSTRYLIGQSLGGLLATEILLKKPKLFTHYLIVSPSLWWDNESLLKNAKSMLGTHKEMDQYVYIAVGGKEDKIMQREAKEIAGILKKPGMLKLKVDFLSLPNEDHATVLHQSIMEAFKKLFPYEE